MKNYRYLTGILALLTVLVWINAGRADFVKKGQVGFRFLENPVSAEAIGRGGLGLITFRNSNTVFWNPAGLGWIEGKYDFNANYTKGIADINYSSFVGAVNFGKIGVIAIDLLSMDYGEFQGTRRADNDQGFEDTDTFSPTAYSVGLTYSQKVSNRFSYGVRVKYVAQDLTSAWVGLYGTDVTDTNLVIKQRSYSATEPSVDVGTTYDFLKNGIRFGAVIQNFSREVRYEREKFPLPFSVSFSIGIKPLSFFMPDESVHALMLGFETNHPRDYREKIRVGAEYTFQNLLILRTGYMANYDERGWTFGMGVRQVFSGIKYRIDYAYQDFGIFNGIHTFTIGLTR